MKVTPEMDVPIMPKATTYQGDFRLPTKKEALSAPRLVMIDMKISVPKYTMTMDNKIQGFIITRIVKTFNQKKSTAEIKGYFCREELKNTFVKRYRYEL